MRATDLSERGVTLTELTVVTVLAAVVMLGLTGFYLTSQFTWMDGSAKAMVQREGTFLLQTIRDSTHGAASYDVTGHQLSLYKIGESNAFYVFRWDPSSPDSFLLAGPPGDEEKIVESRVRRFDLAYVDDEIVALSALELVSATGQPVTFQSRFALLNHEAAP